MSSLRSALAVSLETIRLNPLRSILSTLGVIIGVGSLVAVLSLGDGMELAARAQIAETTDLLSLAVDSRTSEEIDGQSFSLADTVALVAQDLRAVEHLPGVASAAMIARAGAEVRSADSATRRMASLMAATGGFASVAAVHVVAGRFFTDADGDSGVAVVSRQLSRDLAGARAEDALGKRVRVNGWPATVVGVLEGELGRASRGIIVPLAPKIDSIMRLRALHFPSLVARAARIEDVKPMETAVRGYLQGRSPPGRLPFLVQTYGARAEQASQGILIFKLLMGAITGISLIVGGIGIMNVLLASVTERTREIGIRKAAGARHRDILLQFLAESVTITGLGGIIGVVLGLSAAYGITAAIRQFANAPFLRASFAWSSVLVAAVLSVLIGVAFGTYPARRAARLSPIDAIRHE